MKEIKEERIVHDSRWEAIDGTIFYTKEECEKYDLTANAIIRAKFKKLVLAERNEYSLFNAGSDENTVYVVKMPKAQDADTVKQLYIADHDWLKSSDNYKKHVDEAFGIIDKAYEEKDILLIGEDCEGEIYIVTTRNTIIDRLKNLDNYECKGTD